MRYQGRIQHWTDDRGFGFIAPNGGGPKVFLHVKDLPADQPRPQGGELVTYEVVDDAKRGPRAHNVRYVGARTPPSASRSSVPMSLFALALCVGGIGVYGWQNFMTSPALEVSAAPSTAPPQIQTTPRFVCQGKQYCSQMTSCEEATFYLKNCPDAKIDGDGDGIPCEEQWCRR